MKENVNVVATASRKNSVRIGEFSKGVYEHNLEQIAEFAPTVVVDSTFLTRDNISAQQTSTNREGSKPGFSYL